MSNRLSAVLSYADSVDPERIVHKRYAGALRRNYGLSLDEYDALYEAQQGLCAICDRPDPNRRLCVDHCHETGEVRGLLCSSCNTALGLLGDDVDRLIRAMEYLEAGDSA